MYHLALLQPYFVKGYNRCRFAKLKNTADFCALLRFVQSSFCEVFGASVERNIYNEWYFGVFGVFLRWVLDCANRRARRYLAIPSTGSKIALISLFILLRIFIDLAIPSKYNESITNEGETTMRINVQVIEDSPKEKARRALLAKVIKPYVARERVYEPFEYEPYEAEREIIAERLAEMGLK